VTLDEIRRMVRLHGEFLTLLAQLATLPHGSTANWNSSGGKSCEHPGGKRPAGEAHPDGERLLEAWERARTVAERQRVLDEGRKILSGWRHSPKVEVKEETLSALYKRIRTQGEGWPVPEVARALKVTERQVRKARVEGGLHPETGKERQVPAALNSEQRKAEVVRLVDAGWKAKNVAMHLGVAYKTVLRDLENAV
jgi:hypothetical protein